MMGEGHRTIFSKQMYYSDYNFKKLKLMLFFHKSLFPLSSCQRNILKTKQNTVTEAKGFPWGQSRGGEP